ncbi:hypothetical protein SeMB42_g05831 [Synchytrium endobioticum]|uniref:Uncharacterized protein n=1 Tax=Synchytrium endobioticum TaxID=286115 RepID=A0A507CXV2_9FUNG|nr:hypothetical protein SeMB42_g05831 [Synchytrium endobioticum]TPX43996.1 hypothetical protein SeLEV6574_g04770 [Synchytrium endobioticum]
MHSGDDAEPSAITVQVASQIRRADLRYVRDGAAQLQGETALVGTVSLRLLKYSNAHTEPLIHLSRLNLESPRHGTRGYSPDRRRLYDHADWCKLARYAPNVTHLSIFGPYSGISGGIRAWRLTELFLRGHRDGFSLDAVLHSSWLSLKSLRVVASTITSVGDETRTFANLVGFECLNSSFPGTDYKVLGSKLETINCDDVGNGSGFVQMLHVISRSSSTVREIRLVEDYRADEEAVVPSHTFLELSGLLEKLRSLGGTISYIAPVTNSIPTM